METPTALITGGSRGVGAAAAVSLAEQGFDVAITYREKKNRAAKVVDAVRALGRGAIALGGDMTDPTERHELFRELSRWTSSLDALVLNASGGLERNRAEDYPTVLNRDSQLAMIDKSLPMLRRGSTLIFVTSHWAHLFGSVEQLPHYDRVAQSKYLGEMAIRDRQSELSQLGVRLLVVTGDVVDGTVTAKLLENHQRGFLETRKDDSGKLVTTETMGRAITAAIMDASLPAGHTVVVGAPLESLRIS